MKVDEKLFNNNFKVHTGQPHLSIKNKKMCAKCKDTACVFVCPVKNYQKVNGDIEVSWEGCLECGSCRVACKHGAIEWNYPQGGFGIKYRFG